jgi:hypothetical protein
LKAESKTAPTGAVFVVLPISLGRFESDGAASRPAAC